MRLKDKLVRYSRQDNVFLAAIAILAITGMLALTAGVSGQQDPPMPPISAAGSTEPVSSGPDGPALPRSKPVSINIPAINVQSEVISLGKNPDGTIAVPQGTNYDKAAWYKHSPTPGQYGPAIIEGHLDSAQGGASVFFRLGDLRPGDMVRIQRADGKVAVFEVNGVRKYAKGSFPTKKVYGFTDHAALRLITCGGSFNEQIDRYNSNIIVFASLVDSGPMQS